MDKTMMNGAGAPDDLRIEEWVVVTAQSGQQYLGRIPPDETRGWTAEAYRKTMLPLVAEGAAILLDPVFEFTTRTEAVPSPTPDKPASMRRGWVVLPIGVAYEGVPLRVRPAAIYMCADMKEDDRAIYTKIIHAGFETLKEMARTRAQMLAAAPRPSILTGGR